MHSVAIEKGIKLSKKILLERRETGGYVCKDVLINIYK